MEKIQFQNTLSGQLDEFKPIREGEVGFYTCGPTVYDYAHIGNFRAFVFEDLLRRFLQVEGYSVKHVMNLTDVDDKTIGGAQREKLNLNDYTAKFIQAFNEDLETLNCLAPSFQPRATEKMKPMQDLIARLIDKEIAYAKDGSVYYRVSKFPGYGKLSKKKLEMNIQGASERIESDEYESKEQASDFVLWKGVKAGEEEIGAAWDSPWGKGRPGWHIECSAMSVEALGPSFDIHAGGEDLIFPHHENEIAQSEGATGDPFVKYWLHCKFLLVNGEKMSKSKGNFFTLRDLLAKGYDPMAIRYVLLSTHYRSTLNFTEQGLKEAADSVKKMDDCFWQCFYRLEADLAEAIDSSGYEGVHTQRTDEILKHFSDDLNVAAAIAAFFAHINWVNANILVLSSKELKEVLMFFRQMDDLFGFGITTETEIPQEIQSLMEKRLEVRRQIKETGDKSLWKDSDALRDEIQSKGWLVKDAKPGEPSTLKKKRRAWD